MEKRPKPPSGGPLASAPDAWRTRNATPQAELRQRVPDLVPAGSARSAAARSKVSELVKTASTAQRLRQGRAALSGPHAAPLAAQQAGLTTGMTRCVRW